MVFIRTHDSTTQQRRMLLVYHIYRLLSIAVLFGLNWVEPAAHVGTMYYNLALALYLVLGLLFLYFGLTGAFNFEKQVLFFGTVDVVAIVLLIDAIGYAESGLGILLYATVAVLSILAPGRMAIYFASIASLMLLLMSVLRYEYGGQDDLTPFFYMGLYGIGFFATAITTWFLANWVRVNEVLAEQRGQELISILRVGEYFVEQVKYGVIYVDAESQVQLLNRAASLYFNVIQKRLPCPLESISRELFQKYRLFLTKNKKRKEYAQTYVESINVRVQFFSAVIGNKTAVLILLEDMAEIEQQAQQFKLASLGRFSASIAHELRNPLGVISHAIQLMGEDHVLPREDLRLKELIERNCARMNRIIKNVLQLSRRDNISVESIELSAFLKAFCHQFKLINACDMTINIQQNKSRTVLFDRSQLDQILVILCDNAMQHGRDAKGKVHITFALDQQGNKMKLSVMDTGMGIEASKRDLVFEPFYTTLTTGNGMGLFLAKDLCEMNGARLVLASAELGCCFSIVFNNSDEIQL